MNYADQPTKDLIAIHNDLARTLGEPELTSWKKAKTLLIERLEALQALMPQPAPEPGKSDRTIREASLAWLCHVDYYEDKTEKSGPENRVEASHPNARSVGIPYLDVIAHVQDEFPGAQTSVACLRWYAVKVRAEEFGYEGYRLAQRRPRAKPAKK